MTKQVFKDSFCIKIQAEYGQITIKSLKKIGLINKKLKIKKSQNALYIPILHEPSDSELELLKLNISAFHITTSSFIPKKYQIKKTDELLVDKIPKDIMKNFSHSMDIIGDIAIIEIPPELKKYDKLIAKSILKIHKNIKSVFSKLSPIKGVYRLRSLKFLSGENRTYTIHKEYGCKYYLDITKAYFSPRLSQEHNRVASLIKKTELVVDLFAGVGPYSILIAKKNPKAKIISVDMNPSAIEFLKKNIKLNRVHINIVPLRGDSRQLIYKHLIGLADRVIMNLPESASEFIDVVCSAIKPTGGIIHYYEFVRHPDSIEKARMRLSTKIKQTGREVDSFLFVKKIRETAPYQYQVAFDVLIH
jgi:tRNA (guanine37-N1)-methyltransferase